MRFLARLALAAVLLWPGRSEAQPTSGYPDASPQAFEEKLRDFLETDGEDTESLERNRIVARLMLVRFINASPTDPNSIFYLRLWPWALEDQGYTEQEISEELATLAKRIPYPGYDLMLSEPDLWDMERPEAAFPRLLEIYRADPNDVVIQSAVISALNHQWELSDKQRGDLMEEMLETARLTPEQRASLDRELRFQRALGQPFEFRFETIDGNIVDTAKWRGEAILVDYWATYCAPCIREFPRMREIYEEYEPRGLHIVGLALDPNEAGVRSFVRREKLPWPIVYPVPEGASSGMFASPWQHDVVTRWGINSIPRYILIGRDGTIAARSFRLEEIEEKIVQIYSEGKP